MTAKLFLLWTSNNYTIQSFNPSLMSAELFLLWTSNNNTIQSFNASTTIDYSWIDHLSCLSNY